jgi:DNA mismatch repair protein MutL
MVVVDQHAAHERVMFEKLRAAVTGGRTRSQPLLFPMQIELSPLEMAALEEHASRLLEYGLEVEPFGEGAAMIRAVPHGLDAGDAEDIARDALAELADGGQGAALDDLVDRVCSRLACHGSVRAGQQLAPEEIGALLRDLDRIDLGAHCPHGRPVVRTVPYDEMARWFDRH